MKTGRDARLDNMLLELAEIVEADLTKEALRITEVIVVNGGMATKSAVEDVLMAMFHSLTRYRAHAIMNHLEVNNMRIPDRRFDRDDVPTLDEYAQYMEDVEIRWYKGNPLGSNQ